MLTSQEIYNFLMKHAEDPASNPQPPGPDEGLPPPMPPPMLPGPDDESRIESLRARLQALIGPTKLASEVDSGVARIFGNTPGELDPEAEAIEEEWLEVLRTMVGEDEEDDTQLPATVVQRVK